MAYHSNRMSQGPTYTRRVALASLLGSATVAPGAQDPLEQEPHRLPLPNTHDHEDDRLPNGKSQKDAIAESDHKQAIKDAQSLVELANEIKADLEKAGSYVVPLGTVKKTEDIEKLAKKLRSLLKG